MNYEFHRRWAGFARSFALLKGRRPYNFGIVFGAWGVVRGKFGSWVDCMGSDRVVTSHGCSR